MLWSPKRRGDLQEVPKIVILLGNSWYFKKLVAEERLATSDNKKAFILVLDPSATHPKIVVDQ